MANDPYWSNTALLMHGDTTGDPDFSSMVMGMSGAKSSADVGTVTAGSGVALATIGGRACLSLLNGSNSEHYVGAYGAQTAVFDGDFTLEWWYYQIGDVAYNTYGGALVGASSTYSATYSACSMYFNSSSGDNGLGVKGREINFNYKPPKNQWNHHAIVVSSGVVSYYCNGVRRGFGAVGGTAYPTVNGFQFGYTPLLSNAGCPGYLSGARLYKGVAKYLGASFTVPAWPELPYSALVDASPNAKKCTAIGSALSAYTATYKYGGGCMRFDGASYVEFPNHADWSLGAGDFTIEFWMAPSSYWATQATYSTVLSVGDWGFNRGGQYYQGLYFWPGTIAVDSGYDTPANAWVHVAVSRQNGTLRCFRNGVLVSTTAGYTNALNTANALRIGHSASAGASSFYSGLIDDVRITKGVARYTAAFTPPAQALPEGATTVSGVITDVAGAFCSRSVFAHSRVTGRLLGTAVSDPLTGAYSIGVPEQCYVVVLDSTGDYGALVLDRIDPVT